MDFVVKGIRSTRLYQCGSPSSPKSGGDGIRVVPRLWCHVSSHPRMHISLLAGSGPTMSAMVGRLSPSVVHWAYDNVVESEAYRWSEMYSRVGSWKWFSLLGKGCGGLMCEALGV